MARTAPRRSQATDSTRQGSPPSRSSSRARASASRSREKKTSRPGVASCSSPPRPSARASPPGAQDAQATPSSEASESVVERAPPWAPPRAAARPVRSSPGGATRRQSTVSPPSGSGRHSICTPAEPGMVRSGLGSAAPSGARSARAQTRTAPPACTAATTCPQGDTRRAVTTPQPPPGTRRTGSGASPAASARVA